MQFGAFTNVGLPFDFRSGGVIPFFYKSDSIGGICYEKTHFRNVVNCIPAGYPGSPSPASG